MQEDLFHTALMVFVVSVVIAFRNVVRRLNELSILLTHYHKDTTRCPDCDHPAIGASFCEDTPYTCPQCGEKFIWKLKRGRYILATNIEGDPRE